jgi:hypothetical protein
MEQILGRAYAMVTQSVGIRVRSGETPMQEIKIKLWRHAEEKDWSAEVCGQLHKHISTETVDDLVEYVLVAAQQALLEPEAPRGNSLILLGRAASPTLV